jgi:hypothetical protein
MTTSRELDYSERLQEYIDRNGHCAEKYFLFWKIRAPFLPTLLLLFSFLLPIAQQHINFLLVDSQIRDYETVFHFQGSTLHSCVLPRLSTSKFASYLGEFELFSQRKSKTS